MPTIKSDVKILKIGDNKIVWLIFMILLACQPKIKVENLENGFLNQNGLQPFFFFTTNQPCDVTFTYWPTHRPNHRQALRDKGQTHHKFVLPHLTPETEYGFQVELFQGNEKITGPQQSFRTFSTPVDLPEFIVTRFDSAHFDGFILLRHTANPGAQLMINEEGKIVWYQRADSALFRPFHWINDSVYVAMSSAHELVLSTFYGDTLWQFDQIKQDYPFTFHHEVTVDQAGHIVALTNIDSVFDLSQVGGGDKDVIKGDGIVVLDREGAVLWEWNIFEHADPRQWVDINQQKGDWSHANALSFDKDGHYLISFRSFDQVWKIDRNSGEVLWKFGKGGDFKIPDSLWFAKQHAAHINSMGDLMLFDNMGADLKSSRALSFKIDELDRKAEPVLQVVLPDSLFSAKQGSVYLIDHQRLLFSSTENNALVITNKEGKLLWYAKSNHPYFRAIYVKAPRAVTN